MRGTSRDPSSKPCLANAIQPGQERVGYHVLDFRPVVFAFPVIALPGAPSRRGGAFSFGGGRMSRALCPRGTARWTNMRSPGHESVATAAMIDQAALAASAFLTLRGLRFDARSGDGDIAVRWCSPSRNRISSMNVERPTR